MTEPTKKDDMNTDKDLNERVVTLEVEVSGMKKSIDYVMTVVDKLDEKLDRALKPQKPQWATYVAAGMLIVVLVGGFVQFHNRDMERVEKRQDRFQTNYVEVYKDIGVLDSLLATEIQKNTNRALQQQFENSQRDTKNTDWPE